MYDCGFVLKSLNLLLKFGELEFQECDIDDNFFLLLLLSYNHCSLDYKFWLLLETGWVNLGSIWVFNFLALQCYLDYMLDWVSTKALCCINPVELMSYILSTESMELIYSSSSLQRLARKFIHQLDHKGFAMAVM